MKKNAFFIFAFLFIFNFTVSDVSANPFKNLVNEGIVAYQQENYSKAIAIFEKIIEVYPKFMPVYNYLALSYQGMGANQEKVIGLFKKAVEMDPEYPSSYEQLSKIYYQLGDLPLAEEYALAGLEHDPDLVSAKMTLGWIYLLKDSKPGEAVRYFKDVVYNDHVDAPLVYFGLGMAYAMNEEHPYVLEMITKLRMAGRDKLAQELERMMQNRNYVPAIASTILPQESVEEKEPLDITSHEYEPQKDMKVRIRRQPLDDQARPQDSTEEISPEEQIRRLQQRGSSGYGRVENAPY